MGLVAPNPGTIFWLLIIFGIVLYILTRFAWKPILNALKERENSIRDALSSADLARKQIEDLKTDQNVLRASALKEKEKILKEARDIKDRILAEAKEKAQQEGIKMITQVREQIENEKLSALNDIRQQIADISVSIAEKILQEKLKSTPRQEQLIQSQLESFKLN